ncbi:YceI family protein [Mucilaginibacter sp. BJC16-A38]|uniref:YceI family protein n=1 Tax=Mucilaginibacter phenanthrenivorans TaxID=1234842 RepID=UPI002158340D|nr:YceI family protein [Mucilaginibacter phenanthrenivorans]MCR8557594.1 YceI family protein [Mucilaginibacter phenanthrenivorans]
MKRIILLLLTIAATTVCMAQYKPVEQSSTIKFTIKNLGIGVDGTFSGFEGVINFDAQNPGISNFDVTANAQTVNTDNGMRDEHLKGSGFFDVKNYPRIRLVSTKITATNKTDVYLAVAQLTIKGKSKSISFPFTVTPSADGYTFKGSFKMNRRDFNVGGASIVSDELVVFLNVTAKKSLNELKGEVK